MMAKSNNIAYSEIPYDDFYPTIKYRNTSRRLLSTNHLVILLLFSLINHSIANQLNSTLNQHEAYFNPKSQMYHLAQDQYKVVINRNFEKLKDSSYYCFKEGTNWNQSLADGKCVCKPNYKLLDCGLNDQLLASQLLRKQSNCHFEQDIVNIKRQNIPSRIIFAMPLYECSKRPCFELIADLVKQYEYIVDLFVFIELRESGSKTDKNVDLMYNHSESTTHDERIHLYKLNTLNEQKINQETSEQTTQSLNSQASSISSNSQQINQSLFSRENILYQIKTIDLDGSANDKDSVEKVYINLWNLVMNNVVNYRENDKIVFLPSFNKVNDKFLNFQKFYYNYGEPIVLVDNYYARLHSRARLPKDIQDSLNSMEAAVMFTYQYAKLVCESNFTNFVDNYCLNNLNLVNRFEKNFWKVCKVTTNVLTSLS